MCFLVLWWNILLNSIDDIVTKEIQEIPARIKQTNALLKSPLDSELRTLTIKFWISISKNISENKDKQAITKETIKKIVVKVLNLVTFIWMINITVILTINSAAETIPKGKIINPIYSPSNCAVEKSISLIRFGFAIKSMTKQSKAGNKQIERAKKMMSSIFHRKIALIWYWWLNLWLIIIYNPL